MLLTKVPHKDVSPYRGLIASTLAQQIFKCSPRSVHVFKHLTISRFSGSNPKFKSVSGFRVCSFNKIVPPRGDVFTSEAV